MRRKPHLERPELVAMCETAGVEQIRAVEQVEGYVRYYLSLQ